MKKIILVTGGNRGIGREICRQLSIKGHQVILGSRDLTAGQVAAQELGNETIAVQLDVTDSESVIHAFETITAEFGKLDVLINNAGVGTSEFQQKNQLLGRLKEILKKGGPIAGKLIGTAKTLMHGSGIVVNKNRASSVAIDSVKSTLETNLYGPWRMIQVFLPLLKKSHEGRIINMSSGMGQFSAMSADYPAYRVSKSSLNALTLMLADELKNNGMKVNAMCPGWVRTDMGGPDAPRKVSQGADTAVWLALEEEIPTGKFYRDRRIINW